MKNYSLKACEDCIDLYINKYKGDLHILDEGSLGLGLIVLTNGVSESGKSLKSSVITEFFISAWKSGHKVRKYNSLPLKYRKAIEES